MRRLRFLTPALALMLLAISCKDKSKPSNFHQGEVTDEQVPDMSSVTETDTMVYGDGMSVENDTASTEEVIDAYSDNVKSSNNQKAQKFRGVQSDLRDFSDDPESSKKEVMKEIAKYQDELQSIAFNGKKDFKRAEGLARKISSLFSSIGAKDESARWQDTADSYQRQSK